MHDADKTMEWLRTTCPHQEQAEAANLRVEACEYAPMHTPTHYPLKNPVTNIDATIAEIWKTVGVQSNGLPKHGDHVDPRLTLPENLDGVFNHKRHFLPRDGISGAAAINTKMIHRIGVCACVEFVPSANGTGVKGILKNGAKGIMRLSNGNSGKKGNFSPGVGLKFPVIGKNSADMVFGASFDVDIPDGGTVLEGRDFLLVNLRTWIGSVPVSKAYRDIRTLLWVFDQLRVNEHNQPAFTAHAMSPMPLHEVSQDGTAQATDGCPAGLVLRPSKEAKSAWRKVRRHAGKRKFRKAFRKIKDRLKGETLYYVDDSNGTNLGSIKLTTEFVASEAGDLLYFRHPMHTPDPSVLPHL